MEAGWFDGLLYPLNNMRPQSFLGRNFARQHAEMLLVPVDPTAWSDDYALHAMSLLGVDLPGNLIVGAPACRQWLARLQDARLGRGDAPVPEHTVEQVYASLAETTMAQGVVGSSAGDEFPKFTAMRQFSDARVQHVIVKFSGSNDSADTQRWANLLVCEHLSSLTRPTHLGIGAASAAIAFWQVATADQRISAGFRAICADNAAVLHKLMLRWSDPPTQGDQRLGLAIYVLGRHHGDTASEPERQFHRRELQLPNAGVPTLQPLRYRPPPSPIAREVANPFDGYFLCPCKTIFFSALTVPNLI